MSKKHLNEPLPLALVRNFEKEHPGCWALAEDIIESKRVDGKLPWNDLVYLPAHMAGDMFNVTMPDTVIPESMAAFASWRRYKQIFHFNESLVEMLMKNSDSTGNIPVEALKQLPFSSFYIEFDENSCFEADGCFVYFDSIPATISYKAGTVELNLLIVCDKKPVSSIIIALKENMTFSKCVENYLRDCRYDNRNRINQLREYLNSWTPICAALLLYICAINADVSEDKTQKSICIQSKTSVPFTKPKDVFREICKWNVGFRIGNTFKTFESDNASSGIGSKKRPHVRRAHFHHYWVGKKGEERKLVIKWISSMYVNASGCNDIIASTSEIPVKE